MAPTVCSEKKVRLASMKDGRRRGSMGVAQTSSATTVAPSTASGATQNSYVYKGSMNLAARQHRRRLTRLSRRVAQRSPSSSDDEAMESNLKRVQPIEHMELVELADDVTSETSTQKLRTHSSNENIITVLQPTTAHNNNNTNNIKKTTVKLCDHEQEQPVEVEEDHGNVNIDYDFAVEPIKLPQIEQAQQQQHHTHNNGLISIAIKTFRLVQRNKLLQQRLAQLQLETSEFIASVLANPENQHFRDNITAKKEAAKPVSNVLLRN